MQAGNIDEEIVALRQDLIRDPFRPGRLWTLGISYFVVGRLDEAARTYESLLEMSPNYSTAHGFYAQTLLFMGKREAALAAANAETDELQKLTVLSSIYWALGRHADSDAALGRLEKEYGNLAPSNIADDHAFRGEIDAAFEWLERGYRQRDPGMANVKFDPYFRAVRSDPRFAVLLKKMNLQDR
jgi:tetratricopeptide (TPR) repeat protein